MKNAVVTLAIGDGVKELAGLTHPLMRDYAERVGADFVVIDKVKIKLEEKDFEGPCRANPIVCYQKYQMRELLDTHDRLLYVDADVVIRQECPNIFGIVPGEKLGVLIEDRFISRENEIAAIQEKFGSIGWKKGYFNAGVIVVSRAQQKIFDFGLGRYGRIHTDQTQLNYNARKLGIPIFDLGLKFNHLVAVNDNEKILENRFKAFILHYSSEEGIMKMTGKTRIGLIKEDLEKMGEEN